MNSVEVARAGRSRILPRRSQPAMFIARQETSNWKVAQRIDAERSIGARASGHVVEC